MKDMDESELISVATVAMALSEILISLMKSHIDEGGEPQDPTQ